MFSSVFILDMTEITAANLVWILLASLFLGAALAGVCLFTHRDGGCDRSFASTLVLLPPVMAVVILLVQSDIAKALSLAGVFTLVRFRATMTNTKDVAYIFVTLAIGLSCGLGYLGYAAIVTVVFAAVLAGLSLSGFDRAADGHCKLKVVIPENLNYAHAFDRTFRKFAKKAKLHKVRTTEFGTMFELTYVVDMKPDADQKEFIDELRVKNGNLTVMLTTAYEASVTE
ncbi:MAG: DUF4956 domain-containing protein [Candidatus Izemoplasmatales bacterium]